MAKSYKYTQSSKVTVQQWNNHVMEAVRRKKLTKSNSASRSYQAQQVGMMRSGADPAGNAGGAISVK